MTVIHLADRRDNERERHAVAEIITASLIDHTDTVARAIIGVDRIAERDDTLAATIVEGWIAEARIRAHDASRSRRERAVFELIGGARKGDPIELLARKQVGDHLALIREIYVEYLRDGEVAPQN